MTSFGSNIETQQKEQEEKKSKKKLETLTDIIKRNPNLFDGSQVDLSKLVIKTKDGDKRSNQRIDGVASMQYKTLINEHRNSLGLGNLVDYKEKTSAVAETEKEKELMMNTEEITTGLNDIKLRDINKKVINGEDLTFEEYTYYMKEQGPPAEWVSDYERKKEWVLENINNGEELLKEEEEGETEEEKKQSPSESTLDKVNRDFYIAEDWEVNGEFMHNKKYDVSVTKKKYDEQIKKHGGALDTIESNAGPTFLGSLAGLGAGLVTENPFVGAAVSEGVNAASRGVVAEVNEETAANVGSLTESDLVGHDSNIGEEEKSNSSNVFDTVSTEGVLRGIFNTPDQSLYEGDSDSLYQPTNSQAGIDDIISETVKENENKPKPEMKKKKKLMYKGAIHKDAIALYFGSSKSPKWNWTLFAGRELNYKNEKGKKYLYMQSSSLVKKYGIELFVYQLRYSSNSKPDDIYRENHEILQLYFSYINNKNQFDQIYVPGLSDKIEDQNDQFVRVRLKDLINEHNLLDDAAHEANDYNNYVNIDKTGGKTGEITPALVDEVAFKIKEFKNSEKIKFGNMLKVPNLVRIRTTDDYMNKDCSDEKSKVRIISGRKINARF